MTDLYLIAHKVRGEPAFDVACQIACPICATWPHDSAGCHECDSLGYWWIIPTSGHRAYPWWSANLLNIDGTYQLDFEPAPLLDGPGPMPSDLPDHYIAKAAPKVSLSEALGIGRASVSKPPPAPIARRF